MDPVLLHQPVLLGAIREIARARGAVRVVDATVGFGGHSGAFLALGSEVLAIDQDPEALAAARARLGSSGIRYLQTNFAAADALAAMAEFRPDLILLDLGVSSRQLDCDARGFTFRPGAPLDMRMDADSALPTAADLLATATPETLRHIFREYGDERRARALGREIVRRRDRQPLATSDDLVKAIRAVLGPASGPADFARLFQAVRIAVNRELDMLEAALPRLRDALAPGGILLVISYHSGEDRLVKHAFRDWTAGCRCPPDFPLCRCGMQALGAVVPRKPLVAGPEEIARNPRARSAKLRGFQPNHDPSRTTLDRGMAPAVPGGDDARGGTRHGESPGGGPPAGAPRRTDGA